MSYADRDHMRSAARGQQPVDGLTGAATEIKSLLSDLAGEIEDSRRRQSNALFQIERKLHALEAGRSIRDDKADHWSSDAFDDEAESGHHYAQTGYADPAYEGGGDKSWLHERFAEISQHIAKSFSEMRPHTAVHALGERIELFHERVHDALEDVAKRSDVEGLRLIEAHVLELGNKLSDVQSQLGRLDTIESDLRTVMDEVSGERLVRLNEHQDVVAGVINTTAARTAEELHARMAEANAISAVDGGRFDELRGLIESAIIQQRQAEENAAIRIARMGAGNAQQTEGLSEIKALVESSINERRKGEQDAIAMLDTVQQALVEVLDRIDALEAKRAPEPQRREQSAFTELPPIAPAPAAPEAAPVFTSGFGPASAPPAKAERAPAWDIPSVAPAPQLTAVDGRDDETSSSPVERMRREFIADAQRAKLKAATSWAEGAKGEGQKGRKAAEAIDAGEATSRAKVFGVSPSILAAALGLIVAINGGILLISRKSPAPPIAVEAPAEPLARVPGSDSSDMTTGAPRDEAGPRMDRERGAHGDDAATPLGNEGPEKAADAADTNLDQDGSDAAGGETAVIKPTAQAPLGLTLDTPVSASDETLAALYQQQVLSGLAERTGSAASRTTPNTTTPEHGDRVDTAYTPSDTPKAADAGQDGSRATTLDLPPATVGPLSLRLAAAAGDPSAEFEVAARLAEGKGTDQNFKEAVRWYQRSASQGFAQAQYRIGTMYERGLGVPKDLGRARVWYQRAAEQGNVKAMHNLAVLSASGDGGGPDYQGATSWFIKAAEHGLPDSQYNLGVLYENGLGVPHDDKTAYKWYTLAARGGDRDATERRDALKATLSARDLKLAEALIAGFTPKPANALANDPRAAGEDWKKRANADG